MVTLLSFPKQAKDGGGNESHPLHHSTQELAAQATIEKKEHYAIYVSSPDIGERARTYQQSNSMGIRRTLPAEKVCL
jgi:hypothetical protein